MSRSIVSSLEGTHFGIWFLLLHILALIFYGSSHLVVTNVTRAQISKLFCKLDFHVVLDMNYRINYYMSLSYFDRLIFYRIPFEDENILSLYNKIRTQTLKVFISQRCTDAVGETKFEHL